MAAAWRAGAATPRCWIQAPSRRTASRTWSSASPSPRSSGTLVAFGAARPRSTRRPPTRSTAPRS
eukprot:8782047-Alexandrium_andersonii.AAC.1